MTRRAGTAARSDAQVRRPVVRRRTRLHVPLVLAALVAGSLAPGAQADGSRTYGAPFAPGPSGGDSYSTRSAEPAGRITVARAYPVPAAIGCGAGAPYASLRVVHPASAPVTSVQVDYTEAAVEPYTFLTVGVRDGDEWLASRKQRGPLTGAGTVTVPVAWPAGDRAWPRTVRIDVGLESSAACPSVNGGTVRLTSVRVS